MANRQLEDLERAQVETTQALRLLNAELRRSRDPQDIAGAERLLRTTPQTQTGGGAVSAAGTPGSVQSEIAPAPALPDTYEGFFLQPSHVATRDALGQTTRAVETLSQSLNRNTLAVENNSKSLAEGIRSVFASLVGLPSKAGGGFGFLSGGFGLASLGLRIAGLFGGDKDEPVDLTTYELPPSIDIEAVNKDRILAGLPRTFRGQSGEVRAQPVQQAPSQVVVNVNALDTQSFLDRSSDIARAVREAMLHMHPLNDMVNEV